jgi:pyruvate formate lyase activating enzyme
MEAAMKEAMYWETVEGGKCQCRLCPHQCLIGPGKDGICKNKKNVDGKLMAFRYGEITAMNMDPIEKKPLYHFFPGRGILSVGTFGCNLACSFCQNFNLWNGQPATEPAPPEQVLAAARRANSFGVAYTYNEPYMSFEYVIECARLMRAEGLKNVLVTNGFYNPEPLAEILPLIDAMNIDLKSIRDEFYKKMCKGRVAPVLRTIETASKACLVELTNLLVTGENDSDEDLSALVDWVAGVSLDLPLHFSAYHPMFKFNQPPTTTERLLRAYEIAAKKLHYVYLGNVHLAEGADSYCPHCRALLIHRAGYNSRIENLKGDKCGGCGNKLNFVS